MNSTMTEADIYNIIYNYADLLSTNLQIFIGATIAVIVAVFATRDSLNVYLRSIVIAIYSALSLNQYLNIIAYNFRIDQAIETMEVITAGQTTKLPITEGMLYIPISDPGGYFTITGLAVLISWFCCVCLLLFPRKFLK
ncbi:MAG: hypothetical protein P8H03_01330 [Emcibacteraceae bacterium]|nr:hypothetical protein [Emcibacteraceae bacterium]